MAREGQSITDVFSSDELINLDKKSIDKIKNLRRDNVDDMERLSHLDSNKSKVFEKDYKTEVKFKKPKIKKRKREEKPKVKRNEDEEGISSESSGDSSSESEGEISKFYLDEDNNYFNDPVEANKRKRRKEFESEKDSDWYNQYLEEEHQKKLQKSLTDSMEDESSSSVLDSSLLLKKKEKKTKSDHFVDELEKDTLANLLEMTIRYLNDGETVTAALRRFSPPKQNFSKKNDKNNNVNKDKDKGGDLEKLEELTSIASVCLTKNYHGIYSNTREQLIRDIKIERGIKQNEWEYYLPDNPTNIFGPFTPAQMQTWKDQGFFVGESVAFVRKAGTKNFISTTEADFTK